MMMDSEFSFPNTSLRFLEINADISLAPRKKREE